MSPEIKFHSLVTSATTLIVFSVWSLSLQIVSKYPVASVAVAGVFTLGIYRVVNTIFLTIFRKVKLIKKFILGASYMEGTWVGFFVGHNKNIRYLVETFEQDLSLLKVRGRVYRDDFSYHSSHVSTDATLDTINGKLSYSYDADAILNTHINAGLARFELVRNAREEPAHHIVGYSSDLFHSSKLTAFEDKISDSTSVELSKALEEAEKVYNKYRCVSGEQT
ncbi:hypothetical protein L8S15_15875 [Vibrio sp. S/42/10]|uniref:hypothetical protein n=1 Tax=Vibrio TaxID=662 RepID=UPI00030D5AC2|nr:MULTISPECIES: hypothetical protein [Vibrio]MDH5880570.1 hypothetical protein [Vibrio sp. S/42/10]